MRTSAFLALAGLAAFVTYCFNRGQGVKTMKREVKADLGRWEGEGGNVPAVATPSPAPTPKSSFPDAGESIQRH
jgi:hypothetical protein